MCYKTNNTDYEEYSKSMKYLTKQVLKRFYAGYFKDKSLMITVIENEVSCGLAWEVQTAKQLIISMTMSNLSSSQ